MKFDVKQGSSFEIQSDNKQLLKADTDSGSALVQEVTWSELKSLRDNSQLIPGQLYRITDYECTTSEENTSSAGHVFDIIVLALKNNKLSEEAWAIQHEGDTYFANNKLEAWKLWYSLDNDADRFRWALVPVEEHLVYNNSSFFREPQYDGVNGNYCWSRGDDMCYLFTDTLDAPTSGSYWRLIGTTWTKRYDSVDVTYVPATTTEGKGVIYRMIDEFDNDIPYDFKNILFTKSNKYTNAYTFTYTEDNVIKDASLLASKDCYSNIMKEYGTRKKRLNFNVFYSTSTTSGYSNNKFDADCRNNTFNKTTNNNIFGCNFYGNTSDFTFMNNTFGNSCYGNTFGNNFTHNTFGNNCYSNTFVEGCSNFIFGNSCSNNTFGTYCGKITFGSGCQYITFGNSSSAINYCHNNIIDNDCAYLYIEGNGTAYENYLQNIHIHSGVVGASSSNRRTITVDRGLAYSTDIYANNSQTIILDD